MENFELVDNVFQIIWLFFASAISGLMAFRYKKRLFLTLSLAYACFSMGTLYYVLHLVIVGTVPQVFYVSEISWLAAWLFFLFCQLLRHRPGYLVFSLPAAGCTAIPVLTSLLFHIFGPSWLMCIAFSLTVGAILYLSVLHLSGKIHHTETDILMIACVLLQISVYVISAFTKDYTRFNFYFAADMALTLSMSLLFVLILREVKST